MKKGVYLLRGGVQLVGLAGVVALGVELESHRVRLLTPAGWATPPEEWTTLAVLGVIFLAGVVALGVEFLRGGTPGNRLTGVSTAGVGWWGWKVLGTPRPEYTDLLTQVGPFWVVDPEALLKKQRLSLDLLENTVYELVPRGHPGVTSLVETSLNEWATTLTEVYTVTHSVEDLLREAQTRGAITAVEFLIPRQEAALAEAIGFTLGILLGLLFFPEGVLGQLQWFPWEELLTGGENLVPGEPPGVDTPATLVDPLPRRRGWLIIFHSTWMFQVTYYLGDLLGPVSRVLA